MSKSSSAKQMSAIGLSAAAALSAGFLIIPWEGANKNKEGQHVAYVDIVGVHTACYGQTGKDLYGRQIKAGMIYNEKECLIMLSDSVRHFEREVEKYTKVPFASTFQKASLISFAYNVGSGAYSSSTLLKTLNAGNHYEACQQLLRWKYAQGKIVSGLEDRRKEELQWCTGDVPYEAVATFQDIVDMTKQTYLLRKELKQ